MSIQEIFQQFISDLLHTRWYEYLAVVAGIVSVWCSRLENVWVYPTGLINTIIYIYLSYAGGLLGEASVNFYYTVMSIYGWILWTKKDQHQNLVLHITYSSKQEWWFQFGFFAFCYATIFSLLTLLQKSFAHGAIPWADAFASATAFTGMWLMTRKKVESWYWWMATNVASIPLYFVKHYVFTSIYYVILLVLSFFGLVAWKRLVQSSNKIA